MLRVAAAYAALAWLLIQVAGTLFPAFGLGERGVRIVVIVLLAVNWIYLLVHHAQF